MKTAIRETTLDLIRARTAAEVYCLDLIDRSRTESRLLATDAGPMIALAPLPLRTAAAQALRELAAQIETARQ